MAHFSASGGSIASLFIVVRIGFEPCNNYTLSCSFCCSFTQNIHSFTSTVETIRQIYVH